MTEIAPDMDPNGGTHFLQYPHSLVHYNHSERENGGLLHFPGETVDDHSNINGNGILILGEKDGPLDLTAVHASADAFYNSPCGDPPDSNSNTASINGIPQCLEDYKCPICLDTFINTVKVDCSYGHKFCNFCIQCWINFERHLVTECPVCRTPIFGKSLDLKTDAEIRAIYDSLSEEDKRARLMSIKERLQLEYPDSNIIQPTYPGFQVQVSDPSHHRYNHDLHIPIPLMREETTEFANISPENGFVQNYDQNSWSSAWSQQGMFYPYSWNDLHSNDFNNMNNVPQQPYTTVQAPDLMNGHVHHQHYHHQNQENSRWDTNLYLTQEDTTVANPSDDGRTSNGPIFAGSSHPQVPDQRDADGHNHLHEAYNMPRRADAYQRTDSIVIPPVPSNLPNNFPQVPIPNYSASVNPRSDLRLDQHYPATFSTHPPHAPHLATSPRVAAQQTPLQGGFYTCYTRNCPGHQYSSPAANRFIPRNGPHPGNSHNHCVVVGCSGSGHSPHIVGHAAVAGNCRTAPHTPIRVRPNMPGASSTSIQLPTPNSANSGISRASGSNYRRTFVHANNSPHFSRVRQPVSRCPAQNVRAQFSGGFSLFSSGYMGFQISHIPAMMVGDRYVTSPPASLTHPLVSLIPLNQDGSSTRVCLTFEVHRI